MALDIFHHYFSFKLLQDYYFCFALASILQTQTPYTERFLIFGIVSVCVQV